MAVWRWGWLSLARWSISATGRPRGVPSTHTKATDDDGDGNNDNGDADVDDDDDDDDNDDDDDEGNDADLDEGRVSRGALICFQ